MLMLSHFFKGLDLNSLKNPIFIIDFSNFSDQLNIVLFPFLFF